MAMPSAELARSKSVPADAPLSPALDPAVRNAGADESWWTKASAELERREYEPVPAAEGLEAPNRAHSLRTTFGEHGIEVVPRTGKDVAPAWRFVWETTGFGRPGRMKEVSPSAPSAAGARVVYQRDGWSEWYENTPKGLEQGFTIERGPEGEGPLQIAGTFPQALRPEMRDDGAVDFLDEHGACAIRYGELHVWDANGQELDSRLAVADDALAILVADDGAAYPLTIDPLMTSPAWTAESNQAVANFGASVATAGDVNGDGFSDVIVGANTYDNGEGNEGRVFVYHGSAAGLATSPAWTAEGNQTAYFGTSVATAGDVNGDGFSDVIVGAYFYTNNENFEGRAFVYHGSAAGLATTPSWTAEPNQVEAAFGISVATAGDVNGDGFADVMVGAHQYDNGQADEGRAFVYHGSGTGLALTPSWTAESNQADAHFGGSVSTAGDVNGDGFSDVIVGANAYDNNEVNEGRVFVYHGSAAGLATAAARIVESNQISALFGSSVATAGDVNGDGFSDVIVGAPSYDNAPNDEGRAFVYQGSTTGLATTPAWTAESNQSGSSFGSSVATAGDVNGDGFSDVIVGAYAYDNNEVNEGRAHAYFGSAAGLAANSAWTVESNQANAFIGIAVATAGDVNGDGFSDVIVGASNYDNGQTDEGLAFVYHGSGDGVATSAGWIVEGNQPETYLGYSVSTAGDVNGDGFSDVIVGADGPHREGEVYVYHGSAAGLGAVAAWTVQGGQFGCGFGFSAETAGDVNGDGYSDIIVGAPTYDNGELNEGRTFVYHGAATGLETTPAWTAEGDTVFTAFGWSVGTAGDVNGDGFSDVIIGSPGYHGHQGRAFVYHGSAAGLTASPAWTDAEIPGGRCGQSVGTAGDVNGDGFSDIIVGTPDSFAGKVQVHFGPDFSTSTGQGYSSVPSDAFGYGTAVGSAGDMDGDGYADITVSDPDDSSPYDGVVRVFRGIPGGIAWGSPLLEVHTSQNDWFGFSLETAGDVNGDGRSEIIVGAPYAQVNGVGVGKAFIYGLPEPQILEGDQGSGEFGWGVAAAGDVNGDGFSDVIVGADYYNVGEGRAYVFYGNRGDGLDRSPRQVRTDDSAPIWLLGNSDSDSGIRLEALGRTPAGRGRVRLQYEVKPANVPFDGSALVTGGVVNTGTPGANGSAVELSQLASGLTAETLYHWRLRILTDSPFFPRSRWLTLPYNAPSEADVRTGEATTAVAEGAQESAPGVRLMTIAPNPFASTARLVYTLPQGGRHRLTVYDVLGREVSVLADGMEPSGSHTVNWDGRDARGRELSNGVYFIRLESSGQVAAQKIVIER